MATKEVKTSSETKELHISPVGRVEGDLDVKVIIEDGVVKDAWTEASMFRGFEIILRGKDPQAGLIVTPRVCGICGGSHLYKAAFALDTAWQTELPPNALLIRNIAQACETVQSIPRWFYALFAIDLVHRNYARSSMYEEAVRRFAPFTGKHYELGVTISAKPVEIYAIFGGQWPHSSFMVPGGVMGAPNLADITRAKAIMEYYRENWLESVWLGCSVDRWLENKTWDDIMAWLEESENHYNSDLGFFIRYCMDIGLDKYGGGVGRYIATGTYLHHELYTKPTIEGRNEALQQPSGIYDGEKFHEFDHMNVREDVTHSFYEGNSMLHPWEGETIPVDPAEGKKKGKYSWAKAPRYLIDGKPITVEAGPLARQVACGQEPKGKYWDHDPLFLNLIRTLGPSVMVRVLARMHEAAKLYKKINEWLDAIELEEKFYIKPKELPEGKGFGSTEAARGALSDWIVIEDGKIKNYQIITPTAWNIGPRDANGTRGPMEEAFIGAPIANPEDPIEIGHIARSFDSCLVCTVHVYDGKTSKELAKYRIVGK